MKTNNKLNVWGIQIPGDFGINFKVPIWADTIELGRTTDIYEFIKNNYCQIKAYSSKDQQPQDYMSWQSYNLFSYNLPSLDDIKKNIIESYNQFVQEYNIAPQQELWINGWLNVLEPGQQIPIHNHSMHENSYLSGFINFTENNSTTDIHLPQLDKVKEVGIIKIPNRVGTLVMFPQWVFHSVDIVTENLRISLGFDLHTAQSINYSKQFNKNINLPIHRSVRLI
jgi:hypothetical protein